MKSIDIPNLMLLSNLKFPPDPWIQDRFVIQFYFNVQAVYILKKNSGSGRFVIYYLGNGIDAGAGRVRQLSFEVKVWWPVFVHGELGSETIYRWVAHPQSLLETLLKGTTDSHDL